MSKGEVIDKQEITIKGNALSFNNRTYQISSIVGVKENTLYREETRYSRDDFPLFSLIFFAGLFYASKYILEHGLSYDLQLFLSKSEIDEHSIQLLREKVDQFKVIPFAMMIVFPLLAAVKFLKFLFSKKPYQHKTPTYNVLEISFFNSEVIQFIGNIDTIRKAASKLKEYLHSDKKDGLIIDFKGNSVDKLTLNVAQGNNNVTGDGNIGSVSNVSGNFVGSSGGNVNIN